MKTRVAGGTVVTDRDQFLADVLIEDGVIVALLSGESECAVDDVIDANGLFVLPGGIDVHTHFREPDPNSFEGFASGSQAAAAGGITTVVEMPQGGPTTVTADQFAAKIGAISQTSIIDFALWGGIVGGDDRDSTQIESMASLGAAGFKSFMASSSPSFPAVDMNKLFWAMKAVAPTGVPYGLHAEDDVMVREGIARMQSSGRTDPLAHAESRPPLVEYVAVNAAIFLAERTGCAIYFCHCASASALRLLRDARSRGVNVSVETCPQYLALDTDDLVRLKGFGRCAPALRQPEEVDRIWGFVVDGTIDVVSSDHAAYLAEVKQAGERDIFEAPLGLTGEQTLLPVLWDSGFARRNLSPSRLVQLLSRNPARIFGLDDRKGAIEVGKDADLVLFDSSMTWQIRGADMLYRQKWSPFEGKSIQGRVIRTIRRGETLYEDPCASGIGIVPDAGLGKFQPRRGSRSA